MVSAGLMIGFILIQMFRHQGRTVGSISVQGVLNIAWWNKVMGEAAYSKLQCSLI